MMTSRRRGIYQFVALLVFSFSPANMPAQDAAKTRSNAMPGQRRKLRLFETNALPGSRAIVSILAEGTIVKAGDLVCELDSTALRNSLENLELEVESIQAELRNQTLSIEAAELAIEEEDAILAQARATLSDSVRLAKTEVELIELRTKGNSVVSPPDSIALRKAKGKARDLESQVANLQSTREGIGSLSKAVDERRAEERACQSRLESLKNERRRLKAEIETCRITAKIDGRVVHARWRPRPSSPDGYSLLEAGAMVEESQPLFRISPITGNPPRSRGGRTVRERSQGSSTGVGPRASSSPNG